MSRKSRIKKGVVDFETDPGEYGQEMLPFASCIYFNDENNAIIWSKNCAKKTYDLIATLPRCELYAHNGGKFDFWFFVEFCDPQDVVIINGRIAKMYIGKVVLIDSYLIAPIALDRYKKTAIDYNKFRRENRESHKDEIIDYLLSDCKNTLELIEASHKILTKQLTIGAAAMRSIKASGVKVKKLGSRHDKLFRDYFFGGRVENIQNGHWFYPPKKAAYNIDINSAYPYAMLSDHPHGKGYKQTKKIPRKKSTPYFADIMAVSHGCLPVRCENGNRELYYPTDNVTRRYHATGWEIQAGLDTGTLTIEKINEVLIPTKTINFDKFVHFHYGARLEASARNDVLETLIRKNVLTSGFGKFATNPEKFYDWAIAPVGTDVAGWVDRHNNKTHEGFSWYSDVFGRALWRRQADEETREAGYFDVATAASITGYVRAMTWQAIQHVDTPLYCDTDGLKCLHDRGLSTASKKLGTWKLEMRPVENIVVAKKIHYSRDIDGEEKLACKGGRLKYEDLVEMALGLDVTWFADFPTFSAKNGFSYQKRIFRIRKGFSRKNI